MVQFHNEVSAGEDTMKSVSGPTLLENFMESLFLEDEHRELLKKAKVIINLFAGNLNESELFLISLQILRNESCIVVAVDKSSPDLDERVSRLQAEFPQQLSFHQGDVFQFLKSDRTESTDIITAFGSEYVFFKDDNLLRSFIQQVRRLLVPGGLLICPTIDPSKLISTGDFIEDGVSGIYKKVKNSKHLLSRERNN